MKLIIAIIRDVDNDKVSRALTAESFRVTYVASTGGFLRRGQSTLMIGVEDELLEKAMEIIRQNVSQATESDPRHSIIFVLNVDQYTHY
ncbi:MAG: cyclic-di-AMP receptor [Anaerolineaceae bacterium]|nr:cyclic-di-AMP receptor [Anaerolineaceae bacterium]